MLAAGQLGNVLRLFCLLLCSNRKDLHGNGRVEHHWRVCQSWHSGLQHLQENHPPHGQRPTWVQNGQHCGHHPVDCVVCDGGHHVYGVVCCILHLIFRGHHKHRVYHRRRVRLGIGNYKRCCLHSGPKSFREIIPNRRETSARRTSVLLNMATIAIAQIWALVMLFTKVNAESLYHNL
ncbi:hypothetical protein DFJ77DRAFT_179606 [Powellomyces hirtus]|nr:hypothetical protein DFJ77DRAFT_179606 [Powellomyces hirtus]